MITCLLKYLTLIILFDSISLFILPSLYILTLTLISVANYYFIVNSADITCLTLF